LAQTIMSIVQWVRERWSAPPPPATPTIEGWWVVYFGIILVSVAMQLLTTFGLVTWVAKACKRRRKLLAATKTSEPVAALVPCFLPNEKDIIFDTLQHLMTKMEGVDELDVHLVYNTPKDMPELEERLRCMTEDKHPAGRRLFVTRVPNSKSKAENLNYVIPHLTHTAVAIYDADHHPDPNSLAMAVNYMMDGGWDCVQGSTYIRAGGAILKFLVHAEFFVSYFVLLPIAEAVAGTGFFAGSNGIWRGDSIRQIKFSESMQTEDVESSVRAILNHRFKFSFIPECRSGELAPAGMAALWKQRLRWAMGWDQVTLFHAPGFKMAPLRLCCGLYYLFVMRWLSNFCVVVVLVFNSAAGLVGAYRAAHGLGPLAPPTVVALQTFSFGLYILFVCCAWGFALTYGRTVRLLAGLAVYFVMCPIYIVFCAFQLVVSLCRVLAGSTTAWVVTARSAPAQPLLASYNTEEGRGALAPPEVGRDATCLLVMAGAINGAAWGALLGALLGRRTVHHALFGWVPFGIGATTQIVVDGRDVAIGLVLGVVVGALAVCMVATCRRPTKERAVSPPAPLGG